jgi:hypothetical protein
MSAMAAITGPAVHPFDWLVEGRSGCVVGGVGFVSFGVLMRVVGTLEREISHVEVMVVVRWDTEARNRS